MNQSMNAAVAEEEMEALGPLTRLEERILETVDQLRSARLEKAQAAADATRAREEMARAQQHSRRLEAEIEALRAERRQILDRVEKLLSQIDMLAQG